MIVITGATSQTGHNAAEILLSRGQKVRVLGRSAAKLAPLAAKGAEPLAFEIHDEAALTKAFTGADAVYALNPPDITNEDIIGHYDRNSEALVAAIKGSGVKHVVALSSVGAQLSEGSGPVIGLHRMEERINTIRGLNVLYLRPAYFMENSLAQIAVIQKMGVVAGVIKGDVAFPMIATKDIGAVAADALERRDFSGISTRELLGQRNLSMNEAAKIIGAGIGKPGLSYLEPPVPMFVMALRQAGMSANMAELITEMCLSINTGVFKAEEPRSAKNTTPTSFETFVAEVFAPAFRGKAASA
ncbi:MAG: NmrA family NAD(P)-binding protein [Candidatus Acidiferrales bacterium]